MLMHAQTRTHQIQKSARAPLRETPRWFRSTHYAGRTRLRRTPCALPGSNPRKARPGAPDTRTDNINQRETQRRHNNVPAFLVQRSRAGHFTSRLPVCRPQGRAKEPPKCAVQHRAKRPGRVVPMEQQDNPSAKAGAVTRHLPAEGLESILLRAMAGRTPSCTTDERRRPRQRNFVHLLTCWAQERPTALHTASRAIRIATNRTPPRATRPRRWRRLARQHQR